MVSRLVSIRFSHYNEKARWALDFHRVPYVEDGYLPFFHVRPVKRLLGTSGKADRVSSQYSTPCIQFADGTVLQGSSEIARSVDAAYGSPERTLYPAAVADEVRAYEERVHDWLGPHTRRFAYFFTLSNSAVLRALVRSNVGGLQSAVFTIASPLVTRYVARGLGVNRERFEKSLTYIRKELADMDTMLADGRPFLFGDAFTAADLSAACMLAPALLVQPEEGFSAVYPRPEALVPEASALVAEFRASLAGRHALRMFAEHRGAPVISYGAKL